MASSLRYAGRLESVELRSAEALSSPLFSAGSNVFLERKLS